MMVDNIAKCMWQIFSMATDQNSQRMICQNNYGKKYH